MSYTKQTWATGDTITAEKLNHMEDGIASLSGYDLKAVILSTSDGPSLSSLKGISYASILQKYNNMEFINACFVLTFNNGTGHSIYPTRSFGINEEDTDFIQMVGGSDNDISISETSIVLDGSVTYTYTYDSDTMEYTLTQTP